MRNERERTQNKNTHTLTPRGACGLLLLLTRNDCIQSRRRPKCTPATKCPQDTLPLYALTRKTYLSASSTTSASLAYKTAQPTRLWVLGKFRFIPSKMCRCCDALLSFKWHNRAHAFSDRARWLATVSAHIARAQQRHISTLNINKYVRVSYFALAAINPRGGLRRMFHHFADCLFGSVLWLVSLCLSVSVSGFVFVFVFVPRSPPPLPLSLLHFVKENTSCRDSFVLAPFRKEIISKHRSQTIVRTRIPRICGKLVARCFGNRQSIFPQQCNQRHRHNDCGK